MCSLFRFITRIFHYVSFRNLSAFFLIQICIISLTSAFADLSPNGIDFWENDRLSLPDYGACDNLVLNPSFEAGLRFWGFPGFAQSIIALDHTNFYQIDTSEAYSGSQSLKIKALSIKNSLPLGTFPLPIYPNTNYVLSFYAKGSLATTLNLNVWARGRTSTPISSAVAVNNQWTRYAIVFSTTDKFVSIYFDAQRTVSGGEYNIWLDDVQIDVGTTPTSFNQAPVNAQMLSASRGNFLCFGQSPNFSLAIKSLPQTTGTVSLSIEDFYYNEVFNASYQFQTDLNGKTIITLSNLSNAILASNLRGVFIAKGVFNISGISRPYTDYFRFSIMDFLDNTHKNKDLFNLTYVYQPQSGGPEMERFLERERAIGFGSINYDFGSFGNDLDYGMDEERMLLIEDYGFGYMGRPVLKHGGGEISEANGLYKMTNINNTTNPSASVLADFESICSIKAQNRHWNNIWWFCGESNPGCMPLESYPDAFAKFLIATNKGIKQGNPNAKVLIEGGPWKLDAQSTAWVERYIQDTKRIDPTVQFDGAAAHHYRNFPENPDLDADVNTFLAMLDSNGLQDWPFYINEGGNYCPFNIPEEGISPYVVHSGNSWYMGPLSYDCGRSERICAAFSARNWLVALKYQDRVACMEDFSTPNRYVDIDFTPRFYEKIPNTLSRILGDASFDSDIPLAPYCRGYLFIDDSTSSPIAVIWGYKESVDRWQEEPPLYTFDFGSQDLLFIDLMENEVAFEKDFDGRTVIPLSPFPLFIKGLSGTENQLYNSITNYENGVGNPQIVMGDNVHNGSLTASGAGNWNAGFTPAGWQETMIGGCYQTHAQWTMISSSYGGAVNNTGELVKENRKYKVNASLGGTAGSTAKVEVWATQNSDGTGNKTLLTEVSRLEVTGIPTYTLYAVTGVASSPLSSSLAGYYIQVKLLGGGAYYDNIEVTSDIPPTIEYMNKTLHNGALTASGAGNWNAGFIPAGWQETMIGGCYQTAYQWTMIISSYGGAVNNTGELVKENHRYKVSACLGGTAGSIATVEVWATQNSDGTGNKTLLTEVSRLEVTGIPAYTLYTVNGDPCLLTGSNLDGYYVQIKLLGGGAYYDNTVVTSREAP